MSVFRICIAAVPLIAGGSTLEGAPSKGNPLDPGRLGSPGQQLEEPDGSKLARVRFIQSHAHGVGTGSSTLAAVFTIEDGWHLYWENPGDSGGPIVFDFDAPDGVTIGDPVFPTPARKVYSDRHVDYIYENDVVVFFPVDVDPDLRTAVTVTGTVDWLVCKDECYAGFAEVEFELSGETGMNGSVEYASETLVRWHERLASPVEEVSEIELSTSWVGDISLRIEVPGADRIVFYPGFSSQYVYPERMATAGVTESSYLLLSYNEYLHRAESITGIVEAHVDGEVHYISIRVSTPGNSDSESHTR